MFSSNSLLISTGTGLLALSTLDKGLEKRSTDVKDCFEEI